MQRGCHKRQPLSFCFQVDSQAQTYATTALFIAKHNGNRQKRPPKFGGLWILLDTYGITEMERIEGDFCGGRTEYLLYRQGIELKLLPVSLF